MKTYKCTDCGLTAEKTGYYQIRCSNCKKAHIRQYKKQWDKTGKSLPKISLICTQCEERFNVFPYRKNAKFCSRPCQNRAYSTNQEYHRKHTLEASLKMSAIAKKGSDSPYWRGGQRRPNTSREKIWREQIFKRDNYTCQDCKIRGGRLQADHIKPWSLYVELRYELTNGRTLCFDCHKKTPTYGWGTYHLGR